MTIKGTVTRLVPGVGGAADRVFFRPEDSTVFRKLDGSQYLASGEIARPATLADYQVGGACEFDIEVAE